MEPGYPLLKPTVDLFEKEEASGFASGQLQIEESCQLIMQLIELYPQTTVIIDAMDECNPTTRLELLQALENVLQASSSLVKVFVSSRDDQDIVLRLSNYPNLEIDSQRNSDDIARFVKDEVERLIQAGKLLRHSSSQAEMKKLVINKLIGGATGM
jgi:c-di-GMP-related signal transduction protein